MDRVGVFVDAGYLFAEGARLLVGTRPPRSRCRLEHQRVLAHLVERATQWSGLPLLRTYWYDAASAGPTSTQTALAYQPDLKLRLGTVRPGTAQVGVDSQLCEDLELLARNGAICDALLLAGDADLLVGVQRAQQWGVRVHLLGIGPSRNNQAGALVREADRVSELSRAEVDSFLRVLTDE